MGLCPFHQEKTPSFSVREEEGTFHCFGCGKGGNVFTFLTEARGLSFPEAVRLLAGRVGVEIREESAAEREQRDQVRSRTRLLRGVCRTAEEVYHDTLLNDASGKRCRDYLKARGITDSTVREFRLGYAPPAWHFILERAQASREGWPEAMRSVATSIEPYLLEVGLVKQREGASDKESYDVFRERLIFPIQRSDAAPIAFGGRVLTKATDAPKYLNSRESLIYHKRKAFYGLAQAFPTIRSERHCFLVEGYMDVLSMCQHGFRGTLATCGTAITQAHAQLLKRLVERITIAFDGDAAGRHAAATCFEVFLNSGIDLQFIQFEEGDDPDSLSRKLSPRQLESYFAAKKRSIVDLYLDTQFAELGSTGERSSPVTVGKVAERFVKIVRGVVNPVEQEVLLRTGVERLGVEMKSLLRLLRPDTAAQRVQAKPNNDKHLAPRAPQVANAQLSRNRAERYLDQLVISVLVEPGLAKSILAIPSLADGSPVTGDFPANVRAFLAEVSKSELPGIGSDPAAESPARNAALELFLERFGLSDRGYLEEARRQSRIGGSPHQGLPTDAERQLARISLEDQIKVLRAAELSEVDPLRRGELAQQKLEKIRDLERWRKRV